MADNLILFGKSFNRYNSKKIQFKLADVVNISQCENILECQIITF